MKSLRILSVGMGGCLVVVFFGYDSEYATLFNYPLVYIKFLLSEFQQLFLKSYKKSSYLSFAPQF